MRIVKDGIPFIAIPIIFGTIFLAFARSSPAFIIGVMFIATGLFCLYFFRDPLRTPKQNDDLILAPADGVVMEISNDGIKKEIRIFLSVFNVHLQWAPCAGTLKKIEYIKGKYLPAMNKEAHLVNEQNIFTIETPKGEIVLKQIAGIIARRVVSWTKPGEILTQGQRLGFIKFGSQVDIIIPSSVQVIVRVGEKVVGCKTVMAHY